MNVPEIKKDWRYYLGLTIFIIANILPLIALVVVPLLGLSAGISSVLFGLSLAGGPDVLLLLAAALLGKETLQYLFSQFGGWFKRLVRWDTVSKRRYTLGLWLFSLSFVVPLIFSYIMPDTLRNGDQPGWGFYFVVGADIVFIISFFILGAEFWGKLRALFQYNARVVVDEIQES